MCPYHIPNMKWMGKVQKSHKAENNLCTKERMDGQSENITILLQLCWVEEIDILKHFIHQSHLRLD